MHWSPGTHRHPIAKSDVQEISRLQQHGIKKNPKKQKAEENMANFSQISTTAATS